MKKDDNSGPDRMTTSEASASDIATGRKQKFENDDEQLLECIEEVFMAPKSAPQVEVLDEHENDTSHSLSSAREATDTTPIFLLRDKVREVKVAPMPKAPSQAFIACVYPEQTDFKTETLNELTQIADESQPRAYPMLMGRSVEEHTAVKYWRDTYDPIGLQQIDDKLADWNGRNDERKAINRWYVADTKGKHLSMYKRRVETKNDTIQVIGHLDRLELLNNREDRWPCLIFRKHIEKFYILVNMLALNIIQRRSFEAITILIIMANCGTLAMSDANKEPTEAENVVENIFQVLYTIEMVLKILGLGFLFNKGAYMRDYFNIMDFFIVMSAYASMLDDMSDDGGGASSGSTDGVSLKSLRAFRVLKPLRAVNNIPGLRLIVQSILSALPLLKDTIIVLLFFFLIFAIGGVNLFSGMLRQRCISIEMGTVQIDDSDDEIFCGADTDCEVGSFCGKRLLNPNNDVTSFDNIFWALLVIFQCVTLEGWSEIMVLYQRVYTYFAFLFFLPLVLIGAFFLLNLTLAVINTSFNDAQERIKQKKAEANALLQRLFSQKQNSEEIIDDKNQQQQQESQPKLGFLEYQLAKRAASRIKAFAQQYYIEKREKQERQKMNTQQQLQISRIRQSSKPQQPPISKNQLSQKQVTKIKSLQPPIKSRPIDIEVPDRDISYASKTKLSPLIIKKVQHSFDVNSMQPVANQNLQQSSVMLPYVPPKLSNSSVHEIVSQKGTINNFSDMVIEEEEQSEPTNQSVSEFLQGLESIEAEIEVDDEASGDVVSMKDNNYEKVLASSKLLPHAYKTDGFGEKAKVDVTNVNMEIDSDKASRKNDPSNIIMAFNDLRKANAEGLLGQKAFYQTAMVSKIQSNNLDLLTTKRQLSYEKMLQKRLQVELDFDTMMIQRNKLDGKKSEQNVTNSHHHVPEDSYDKSFFMDSHSDVRSVGNDTMDPATKRFLKPIPRKSGFETLNQAAEEEGDKSDESSDTSLHVGSVISSTSSIEKRHDDLKSRSDKRVQAKMGNLTQEMNQNITRQLNSTEIKSSKEAKSNGKKIEDDQNLNEPVQEDQFRSVKQKSRSNSLMLGPKSQSSKQHSQIGKAKAKAEQKQQIAQVYKTMKGNKFTTGQDKDMYANFNRKEQKISINPGKPYRSTSLNDVFELRNKLKYNQRLKSLNPFIKFSGQQKDECLPGSDSDEYNEMLFEPWQLKKKLRIEDVDEVKFDSDDEDALILQQQPFETVMSISQGDMLSHLSTKLQMRRSDMIVSSTLSITLTPDDNFTPQSFANMTPSNIDERVKHRSDFRAEAIQQATLIPNELLQAHQSTRFFSDEDSEDLAQDVINYRFMSTNKFSQLSGTGATRRIGVSQEQNLQSGQDDIFLKLPKTLLSAPLRPDQAQTLSDPQRRTYNLQKAKHEAQQRYYNTMVIPASQKIFKEEDVAQMVEGIYWSDSDDDEDTILKRSNTESAGPNDLAQETMLERAGHDQGLRLEQFDEVVNKKTATKENKKFSKRMEQLMEKGHIPDSIRNEFNLPQDMLDRDVNFTEVRRMDSKMAIKLPVWSGQDVLATSINKEQALWVVDKINSLRVWPKGLHNLTKKIRSVLKMHVTSNIFEQFMTLIVLLNTIVMAMDRYGIEQETKIVLDIFNLTFTYIFIYEMTLKLIAIGPKKYVASKWNLVDGFVVLLSIVEIIAEQQSQKSSSGSGMSAFRSVKVFRTFRVVRVARILRRLHSMQVIIGVISRSFRSFMYVSLLLILFVFIYTLIGVQIYQGKFDFGPNEDLPAGHFEDFSIAFVTVFQVLTMENWQTVMFDSMRATKGSVSLKFLTVIYYISWIFIGNFILLNLFLAILIDSFTDEGAESNATQQQYMEAEEKAAEIRQTRLQELKMKRRSKLGASGISAKQSRKMDQSRVNLKTNKAKKVNFTGNSAFKDYDMVEDLDDLDPNSIQQMLIQTKVIQDKKQKTKDFSLPDSIECKNSIYLFSKDGLFRGTCYYTQHHRYFDRFIMFLIAFSSSQLAFETYIQDLDKDDIVVRTNAIIGEVFTYLFLLEFLIKLIALGFVMDDGSYLRESWNQLDFFIVMSSIIDNAFSGSEVAAFRILRMLRILRPLRVVSHNMQLKMIVSALLDAGGSIINVIVVILMVFLMFAIFAVNTYKGLFFYCSVDKYGIKDQYECFNNGGEWLRYDSNFDNVIEAMMTLFIVSSLEGWPGIMHQAMDITKEGNGPKFQNNVKQSIFFIIFVLVGSFFFLNFFIGVLFLKYEEAQKREKIGFTQEQLNWSEMQVMIIDAKIPIGATHKPRVKQKWRLKAYNLVTAHVFEVGILVIIVLNMLQMAFTFEGSSGAINSFMDMTNYIFTAIFIIEASLKILAFRWAYFQTSWNRFDFFVVISSILDIFLSAYQDFNVQESGLVPQQSALSIAPQLARVLRVLRVSRVLRIANHYKGLQQLFNTLMLSIPSLLNVFMLLMLFFFILAVLGQFLFSGVKRGDVISDYKNFTVFHSSFLLLFSVSTGEDWNLIMYDCSRTAPDCVPGETCGSNLAPIYFMAVVLLFTYVMLNLFILVIIQQFQKLYLDTGGPLQTFNRDFEIIMNAWIRFTSSNGCIRLKDSQAQSFIKSIPPPLGGSDLSKSQLDKVVLLMSFKSEDGWIYFNELLYRILRKKYGKFDLNKKMQIRELITQYRIFNITMSKVKVSKEQALEKFFRKVGSGGKDTVNPFLANMYRHMSFLAWYKLMLKHVEDKRKEDVNRITKSLELKSTTKEKKEDDSSVLLKYEAVVVDYEVFSEYTVSSDEEADLRKQKIEESEKVAQANSPGIKLSKQAKKTPKNIRSLSMQRMKSFREEREKKELPFTVCRSKTSLQKVNLYLSPESNVMIRGLTCNPRNFEQLPTHSAYKDSSPTSGITKMVEAIDIKNSRSRIGRKGKQKLTKCGSEEYPRMLPLQPLAHQPSQSWKADSIETKQEVTQGTPS